MKRFAILLTLILITSCGPAASPSSSVQIPEVQALNSQHSSGFAVADGSRPLSFPQDLGAHEDFRTEWWYYTGNLQTPEGRPFGFELTIFRVGLLPPSAEAPSTSKWYGRSIYFAPLRLERYRSERIPCLRALLPSRSRFGRRAGGSLQGLAGGLDYYPAVTRCLSAASRTWFLAGTFGGRAERWCTVPKDRAVFYPLVNAFWVDCPESPDEDLTDDQVRAIMATYGGGGDKACQLTSTLDGVAISSKQVPTIRSQSPTFSATLPEGHVLVGSCYFPPDYPTDLPPGETGRMISEVYWVMLPPLSRGEHTLTLHGAGCDPTTGAVEFEVGVTYHLTVN